MKTLIHVLTLTHVIAGFLSLAIFWIPIFTRKGGINHVRLGKAYVFFMWMVVGSAALLSVKNVVIGEYIAAAFLGFLSLITANPLWYGIGILKHKKGTSAAFQRAHQAMQITIVLAGFALIAYGIVLGGQGTAILMFIFGGLGVSGLPQVVKYYTQKAAPTHWLKEHIVGMCSTGIAAYTAFFVFGGRSLLEGLLTGYWSVVPWVAPTVIGSIAISLAVRKRTQPKSEMI